MNEGSPRSPYIVYKDVIHRSPVLDPPEDLTTSRRDSRVFLLSFYSRELKKPKELPDLESNGANAKQTLNPAIRKTPVTEKSPTGNPDNCTQEARLWIMFWGCWELKTKIKSCRFTELCFKEKKKSVTSFDEWRCLAIKLIFQGSHSVNGDNLHYNRFRFLKASDLK